MTRSSLLACLCLLVSAAPARAERIFFSATGRSLSVKGHHVDGDMLVLTLRGGGEIVCAPSMIARIEPDEVPYPEPPEAHPQPDAADLSPAEETLSLPESDRRRQATIGG